MKKCCFGVLLVLALCLLASCVGRGEPQDVRQPSAPQETSVSEPVSELTSSYGDVSSDVVSDPSFVSDVPSGTVSDASSDASFALSEDSSEVVSEESSDASSVGMDPQELSGSTSYNGANSVPDESSEEPVKPVHHHSYEGASCTEGGVCSCGKVGEPLGHQMSEATCSQPATCSRCGQTEGEALAHEYKNGYCKYCKDTNGPLSPEEAKLFNRSNKLTDEENAEALKAARALVAQIDAELPNGSDYERIGMAAVLVSQEYQKGVHVEKGNYYHQAYGVLIKRESSCAGCTRTLGLLLSCMGYEWTHVNENKWNHQWVELELNGEHIWVDGQVGWIGKGEYPYAEKVD